MQQTTPTLGEFSPASILGRPANYQGVYSLACICFLIHIMTMKRIIMILSVLAEPTRFKAMSLLWDGREHCVCELVDILGKSQSTVSRHMSALKKAGLVVDRRDAQWVRYRRNSALHAPIAALVDAVFKAAKGVKKAKFGNSCRKARLETALRQS